MSVRPLLLAFLWGLGCGSAPAITCDSEEEVAVTSGDRALYCASLITARRYVEATSGRALPDRERERLMGALATLWASDPPMAEAWFATSAAYLTELEGLSGAQQARRRSELAYRAVTGDGVFAEVEPMFGIHKRSIAVWSRDVDLGLVLSESDIEGWIFYASLCREVQTAGPLRLSVADRVSVYRSVQERFDTADLDDKIALLSMGPYWRSVKDHWGAASFEAQQSWIQAAPLPPRMVATSLGYFDAIVQGPVRQHVAALVDTVGPFRLTVPP